MVPGSTLMYGSSLTIAILRPRASRMAPSEAAAMPFPNEETTPPVTNTKLGHEGARRVESESQERVSTGRQVSKWRHATKPCASGRSRHRFVRGASSAGARGAGICHLPALTRRSSGRRPRADALGASPVNSSGRRARSSTGIFAACISFLSDCVRARAPGRSVSPPSRARIVERSAGGRDRSAPRVVIDDLEGVPGAIRERTRGRCSSPMIWRSNSRRLSACC